MIAELLLNADLRGVDVAFRIEQEVIQLIKWPRLARDPVTA